MQFLITNLGQQIETAILLAASYLKIDGVPGLIALGLTLWLIISIVWFLAKMHSRGRVLKTLHKMVLGYKDIAEFSEKFEDFRADIKRKSSISKNWLAVSEALEEYQETLVREENAGRITLRNAVRPGSFLNIDDLGFGPGVFRILPSIFVSVGLFFTFLGLVGALHGLGTDMASGGSSQDAVIGLMKIASAKFVTSLTGLGCSIVFSYVMRRRVVILDKEVHQFCLAMERRISFVSLEDIGFRQLKATEESRDQFRTVGMEMVADLGRKLETTAQGQREYFQSFAHEMVNKLSAEMKTDLPKAIGDSIRDQTQPLFDKIGNIGASGMGDIVGGLTDQISGSVQGALENASNSLVQASERIEGMADRMDASSGKMGQGMETALQQMASAIADLREQVGTTGQIASTAMTEGAEQLLSVMNTTLEGIRDNTSEGARAMSAAAEEMEKSAEGFRTTIEDAARDGSAAVRDRMLETSETASEAVSDAGAMLMERFGVTSQKIAELGEKLGSSVTDELTGKLEGIGNQLTEMATLIERGAGDMRNASTGLRSGADSIKIAANDFGGASVALVDATVPIRSSQERIETSVRQLSTSTENTANIVVTASERVARDAADVLETARVALGQEREGIERGLEATRAALRLITEQAATLEDVDEKLGRALQHYSRTFQESLDTAETHIRNMHKVLEPGIDTLRSVVEQAEAFVPQARRV